MKKIFLSLSFLLILFNSLEAKDKISALYIPLADHYAAIVAYERYANKMKYADFRIIQMKNWDLLSSYFLSKKADMAFVMAPLALDMYSKNPYFKWIGLIHRNGNALAINEELNKFVKLDAKREDRKPDSRVAEAIKSIYNQSSKSIQVGLPHLKSTHAVILYKYLKDNGVSIAFIPHQDAEVLGISVDPHKSLPFIKIKNARAIAAAFEQSLPWIDLIETKESGKVAWYSKDVMKHKGGHVECITLASNSAIKNKTKALNEVVYYIQKAGADIENARKNNPKALEEIVNIVRKHIKEHSKEAIIASLNPKLNIINYKNLNIDKLGLKQIMDYAVEAGIIKNKIDIEEFADDSFSQKEIKY